MGNRKQLEEHLRQELDAARSDYVEAKTAFREIVSSFEVGADSMDSLQQAVNMHNAALNRYKTAVERLNAFVGEEVIPQKRPDRERRANPSTRQRAS